MGSTRSNNDGKLTRPTAAKEKNKEVTEAKDKDGASKKVTSKANPAALASRLDSKKPTGTSTGARQSNDVNFPDEGRLMIYYVSNLILCGGYDPAYYDQAHDII